MFSCLIIQYVTNLWSLPPPPPTCGHLSLPAWGMTPYSRLLPHVDTLLTNYGSDFPHQPVHPWRCLPDPSRSLKDCPPLSAVALISHMGLSLIWTPSSPLASEASCQAASPYHWMPYSPCLGSDISCQALPRLLPSPIVDPLLTPLDSKSALGFLNYDFRTEIFRNKRPQIGCLKYEETEIQKLM